MLSNTHNLEQTRKEKNKTDHSRQEESHVIDSKRITVKVLLTELGQDFDLLKHLAVVVVVLEK
jgi:hypothetical protein